MLFQLRKNINTPFFQVQVHNVNILTLLSCLFIGQNGALGLVRSPVNQTPGEG